MSVVTAPRPSSTLHGERIELRPLQIENIYKHFEWNNDPELNRLDSEIPYVEETFGEFKRRFERLVYQPSPHVRDFEILAEDGTLIGVASIVDISHHNRHCKIGITIGDRSYWGLNYGREALGLVLEHCFEDLDLHRVSTDSFEYNEAWRKLVEWAGFQKEGSERDYLFRDDAFWDKHTYAILEGEYRDRWN